MRICASGGLIHRDRIPTDNARQGAVVCRGQGGIRSAVIGLGDRARQRSGQCLRRDRTDVARRRGRAQTVVAGLRSSQGKARHRYTQAATHILLGVSASGRIVQADRVAADNAYQGAVVGRRQCCDCGAVVGFGDRACQRSGQRLGRDG